MSEQFNIKHLSLEPVIYTSSDVGSLLKCIKITGEEKFVEFLISNGLAVIWANYISHSQNIKLFQPDIIAILKKEEIYSAAVLIRQKLILDEIHSIFEEGGIEYVLFKGGDLRDTIYEHPTLRPVSDLDILVSENNTKHAIKLLSDNGFKLQIRQENISHETSLVKDTVTIDLHWHLLRPGRTRIELTDYLFKNKVINNHHWGLNYQASLVIMLIHPVITKYLNSPVSRLIHTIDLHYLITKFNIDWKEIEKIMDMAGTKSSAWCSLYWYKQITGNRTVDKQIELFKPGYFHKKYLCFWIDHDLVKRFWNTRILVRLFFGLALHDNIWDGINALINLIKERKQSYNKLKEIIQLTQ